MKHAFLITLVFTGSIAFAKDTLLRDSCVTYERVMVEADSTSKNTVTPTMGDAMEAKFCQGYLNGFAVGTDLALSIRWDIRNAAKSIVQFEDEFPNDNEPLRQRIVKAWLRDGLIERKK